MKAKELLVGNDAMKKFPLLNITYPIENGIVTNLDDAEQIWAHIFHNVLNIIPKDYNILITEIPCNPKSQREKMVEMFEKFKLPATYLAIQSVLALYSCGKTTGLDVSLGDGVIHIVPIYKGYTLPHAILKSNTGGRCLTNFLFSSLAKYYYLLKTIAKQSDIEKVKESCCYVATDFEKENEIFSNNPKKIEKNFSLPDGQDITVIEERFKCPEVLFQPSLAGHESYGIHEMAFNSCIKCAIDSYDNLIKNIFISGGSALFPGLPERFLKELISIVPTGTKVRIDLAPECKY